MNRNERLPLDRILKQAEPDENSKPLPVASERFTDDEMRQMRLEVSKRIREAFGTENMAEIARRCQTSNSTIKPYIDGDRLPIAEMLIQMHLSTGVTLDWLVLGKGKKFLFDGNADLFSPEEIIQIRELAEFQGRSPQQMIRLLAVAQLAALEKLKD